MKAGVNDFVLKEHLRRLPSVVERELREAEDRRARIRAELALRESEERYALALRGANDGVWDWNVRAQSVYYSTRWKQMLGYIETDIQPTSAEWLIRLHPDDADFVKTRLINHMKGHTPHFEVEHRMRHKSGDYRWVLTRGIALRDESGYCYRMAGSQSDISERKFAEEQLVHDSLHDPLTRLANRALFTDCVDYALAQTRRNPGQLIAVLCMNIERFRFVNDSLGHGVGDQLLKATAQRLTQHQRPGDVLARFGSDEFAILLDGVRDIGEATRFAEMIQQQMAIPLTIEGHELFPGTRIGIVLSSSGYHHAENMLRDADTAMHRAKAMGKIRLEVFDTGMHTHVLNSLQLEQDLRRAVEKQEFTLHYQPIVNLTTGRLTSFEALVRWQRHGELVSPVDFIPLAEELGLINEIGRQVLYAACRQLRVWNSRFAERTPLQISVNLSGQQFVENDLIDQVEFILKDIGLESANLKLEITESILMENTESIVDMLVRLRAKNIQILMDDFGTGYSSLSYLHRFPSDVLKIDGSFIRRLTDEKGSDEIVRTIIMLAHNLGMSVIAEGVEGPGQLEQLRTLGCDFAQGYLFSKPIDAEAATRLIEANPCW
jgi:diguanylate cyclase (GGDEF)-like protein/PAS domain S-box-containing protein